MSRIKVKEKRFMTNENLLSFQHAFVNQQGKFISSDDEDDFKISPRSL